MDRAERLLDLVTLFLGAREPVPFRELRDHFEDYASVSMDSALRKFERDKAELLELGLPLTYREPSEADELEGGYRLERDAYFLPTLSLTPTELTLLGVAGATAQTMDTFPFQAQVSRALEKIGFAARGDAEEGRSGDASRSPLAGRLAVHTRPRGDPDRVGQAFAVLQDAISRRKRVSFTYRGLYRDEISERSVEPHGLFLRDGAWVLAGHCLMREAPRTFLLDRMEALKINEVKPKSADFEAPEAPDLMSLARLRPWSYAVEEARTVTLRVDPRLALLAKSLFGEEVRVTPLEDGGAEVELEVRYLEPLIERVLSLRDAVTVLSPPELVDEVRGRLSAFLDAADGEPS